MLSGMQRVAGRILSEMSCLTDHRACTGDDRWSSSEATNRRVVVVAVGAYDRRAVVAMDYARRLSSDELVCVHVATDQRVAASLVLEWTMSLSTNEPLHVIDDCGGVAATIEALVSSVVMSEEVEVVVVVGEMTMSGLARQVLHDRTAAAIARMVGDIPRVVTVLVPVLVPR